MAPRSGTGPSCTNSSSKVKPGPVPDVKLDARATNVARMSTRFGGLLVVATVMLGACATDGTEFRPRRPGHVGPVPLSVVAQALSSPNPGRPFRFAIAALTWSAARDSRLRPTGCTWSDAGPEVQLAGSRGPGDTFILLEADTARVHELWEWDGQLRPLRLDQEPSIRVDRYIAHVCSTSDPPERHRRERSCDAR